MKDMEKHVPQCCEMPMTRMIYPVAGYVQGECRYRCPVTLEGVTSWKQRKEIMARKGLIDANDLNTPSALAAYEKRMAKVKEQASVQPEEIRNLSL
jgi:hypothetical protein